MFKFLHHLLNPHCEHCKTEQTEAHIREEEIKQCPTCLVYKAELDKAQTENAKLLEALLIIRNKPEFIAGV